MASFTYMIMLMQPQNVPPAPPPITPNSGPHNPYDFLNDTPKQKRSMLPSGNSKKQRILIVFMGLAVLLIVGVVLFSFISSSGGGTKEDFISVQQQQAELIRVADIGINKASQSDTKNLAVTAKYTLVSQQSSIATMTKKAGVKVTQKQLQMGKNTKTDARLTAAEQSNQFDQTFSVIFKTQLLTYRRTLEKLRTEVSSKKSRDTLQAYDQQIALLVPDGSTPTSQ